MRRIYLLLVLVLCASVLGQPTTAPSSPSGNVSGVAAHLRGRNIESVRVVGNVAVPTAVILNAVRSREGEPFDPSTVEEDYQRIFALRKFANVEAKVEPTDTGVIVVFIVSEQRQISAVRFAGNSRISTLDLQQTIDLNVGESIDRFKIALARQAIERLYRDKNHPFAHVEVAQEPLNQQGEVVFNIVEGPEVRIRKIDFAGNHSFTKDRLRGQIRSAYWIWIFRPGTYDPETVNEDVAALRRYYEQHGFFDVRVGRKLEWSKDLRELQITFVIEEGRRYTVDRIIFKGNSSVSEADLRRNLKLVENQYWEADVLQRDQREIIRAYSPFGFIYQAQSVNPSYLRIEAKPVFRRDAGKVDLVWEIREGKPFRLGRVLVKGNNKTQDKVVLREMRVSPGQMYNSAEVADAADRLRSTPFFESVTMTPVGDDPTYRDVLVEVTEGRTALFNIGAGVNSNGGLGGNITYEQRNFDIADWPTSWDDYFSGHSFIGAGQSLRISLEPGTEVNNASVRFFEPWLFDQPYSFSAEAYLRNRIRDNWDENRLGGRIAFGKRFTPVWSAQIFFRGEDVEIADIEDPAERAPEIVDLRGHSTLTSIGLQIKRDTTNPGALPYRGTVTRAGWESAGALGGDFTFQKLTIGWDGYVTVYEDLLDRRTVFGLHLDAGYIFDNAPFFERFYGGGIGSLRGFAYRGVSPRAGLDEDPIGGDFFTNVTAELNFPLIGDNFRGVIFSDVGTVERDFRVGTIRSSVGFGIRMILPVFGQAPLALDFAWPITQDDQDDTQVISFSFGFIQ